VAAVLGIPATVEATRASVYSTNGMAAALQAARTEGVGGQGGQW
jgi:hypothetical protein